MLYPSWLFLQEAIRDDLNDVEGNLCNEQLKSLDHSEAKAVNKIQHSQESCTQHSMDVNLPPDADGQVVTQHVTRRIVQAMVAVNMLYLCGSSGYRAEMGKKLECGIPRKGRDAFDAAGKFALSMKLLSLGVKESQIYIDSAQAAGPCGTADGFIPGSGKFLEIKGAGAKSRGSRVLGPNARPQFEVSGLRDGSWRVLTLVGRELNPKDWTCVAEYDACGFWLGVVMREVFDAARLAGGPGNDGSWVEQVAVSPFTEDQPVRRHGSWLSQHVRWVKFRDLTYEWCLEHLLS